MNVELKKSEAFTSVDLAELARRVQNLEECIDNKECLYCERAFEFRGIKDELKDINETIGVGISIYALTIIVPLLMQGYKYFFC